MVPLVQVHMEKVDQVIQKPQLQKHLKKQPQLRKLLLKNLRQLKKKVQVQVDQDVNQEEVVVKNQVVVVKNQVVVVVVVVKNPTQEVRVLQEVLKVVQVVGLKEEPPKVDQKVLQEVNHPQEVLRVVQVVGLKEEQVLVEHLHQERHLGEAGVGQEDQDQGAILDVNLIFQHLQI